MKLNNTSIDIDAVSKESVHKIQGPSISISCCYGERNVGLRLRRLGTRPKRVDSNRRQCRFHRNPIIMVQRNERLHKNETNNVAQSHKARHLFNLMTYLLVMAKFDSSDSIRNKRLAVASCGNAGLAAARVTAAAKWPIDVCIPPDADPSVIVKLKEVGADVHMCALGSTHMLKQNE